MPKVSERERTLRSIVEALALSIFEEDEQHDADESSDDEMRESEVEDTDEDMPPVDELFELFGAVQCSRYLYPRQSNIPKSTEFRTSTFRELPPDAFRQAARMSREAFDFVVSEIEDHPVFHNNSQCDQAPVWQQLAVALDRLGNYGNGASGGRTMHHWGIGKGTCDLYLARVLIVLESLAPRYVRWPTAEERRAMSRRMSRDGFEGCVGFIDGTTIPLSQKPGQDGSCFFDRKHRYSINAQVVCDDRRRVIFFFSGWAGSCADSSVYQEMPIAKGATKRLYFSPGEYLIADSAYPADHIDNTIIPSYRSNSRGVDNEDFNTCVAHVRVVNEHTIGVIKNRFGSLKELRVQIKKKEDMARALTWIQGCIVLHNMRIEFGDEWDDDAASDDENGQDDADSDEDVDDDPYVFRRKIKRRAVARGREPGGILWHNAGNA